MRRLIVEGGNGEARWSCDLDVVIGREEGKGGGRASETWKQSRMGT